MLTPIPTVPSISWLLALAACSSGRLPDPSITESRLVPTTVALAWDTEQPGHSWVEFGAEALDRRVEQPGLATHHEVRLVGLKPGRSILWQASTEIDGRTWSTPVQTFETADLPPAMPALDHAVHEPGASVAEGFVLTTLIEGFQTTAGGGWVVVLDGDGDVVWWFDTGHQGQVPADLTDRVPPGWTGRSLPLSMVLDPAGRALLFAAYDLDQQLDVATLRRVPLDAMGPEDVVTTRLAQGHHDAVLHPGAEGTVGYLAYQYRTIDGSDWASDAVLEVAEGDQAPGEIERVWTWLDDGPADPYRFEPAQDTFSFSGADLEWSHSNSLMYIAEADSYFLMSKFLDCLVKIDRSTGRTAWILGGPFSDFALPDGSPVWEGLAASHLWSHAHMSDLWYDPSTGIGGFAVFDNGSHRSTSIDGATQWSRLAAFEFDERARTVAQTWEYVPPQGGYTTLLGDVDALPGGTWLASWSALGRGIEELQDDGEVLWRTRPMDSSVIVGRAQHVATLDER